MTKLRSFLKGIVFAGALAASLVATSGDAFAAQAPTNDSAIRTDGPLAPVDPIATPIFNTLGVTWED